jgi:hypothetical protein
VYVLVGLDKEYDTEPRTEWWESSYEARRAKYFAA